MSKIKICGLTRMDDIEAVNRHLPDFIGFVFAESKRKVSVEQAEQLKKSLHPNIKAVGVFVNEEPENIISLVNKKVIDLVQLHGDEANDMIDDLKRFLPVPIIKAVRVKSSDEIEKAKTYHSDYILFDTYSKEQYGGTGKSFDWSVLHEINKPFFLAGGIRIENVSECLKQNPFCIDISGGVETNGYKDAVKIKEIINKIRSEK